MKKWLCRGALSPTAFANRRALTVLRPWLLDPCLYCINRRSVAGAVAVGLALMWLPLPVQTLLASAFAIQLRVNLPLSASLVWITNPLTIPPMYYAAYCVGASLTGIRMEPTERWTDMLWQVDTVWVPMMVGCAALAAVCAGLGYVGTHVVWRARILRRLAARRARARRAHARRRASARSGALGVH